MSAYYNLRNNKGISLLVILIPLLSSTFIHLWNPIGYPVFHTDEGHYLRRAMHTLEGYGPQEEISKYDHPYFGQVFFAAIMKITGYPEMMRQVVESTNLSYIQASYLFPRVIIGILAVIDTFLIFKIAELKYNRTIAFISSILFAILPYTLMTRMILLEPIQLPFFLSSMLLAIWLSKTKSSRKDFVVAASGILMGLAIFTKIPIFTMIPLGLYLIYKSESLNKKRLFIWLIPAIVIPMIWPIHAIYLGQFEQWLEGVIWQLDRPERPLADLFAFLFRTDTILLFLGITGLIFSTLRKDPFPLLWAGPYLIFLYFVNYVSSFFFIPVFPIFCITSAILIYDIFTSAKRWKIFSKHKEINHALPFVISAIVIIPALIITADRVNSNLNEPFLKAMNISADHLVKRNETYLGHDIVTVVANPGTFWIPLYLFDLDNNIYQSYFGTVTKNEILKFRGGYLLIVDDYYRKEMLEDNARGNGLLRLYNITTTAAKVNGTEISQVTDDANNSSYFEIKTSWKPLDFN